jgi:cardiolipin synthase C
MRYMVAVCAGSLAGVSRFQALESGHDSTGDFPSRMSSSRIKAGPIGASVAAGLVSVLLLICLGACAPLLPREPHLVQSALAAASSGAIADTVMPLRLGPDQSSYRLIHSNQDALALQVRTAQLASTSLDLAYYMWLNDRSGRLLASELLRAADRGVRVRVLIDDNYVRHLDRDLITLDQHRNIELRVYNPYRTRRSRLGNVFEFMFSGFRLNHRMHNKVWIADGRLAIVGGRNVGDEYYGMSAGFTFRDLGVLLIGLAAQQASAGFDQYWNSPIVIPLEQLPDKRAPRELGSAQKALEADRLLTLDQAPFRAALEADTLRAEMRSGANRFIGENASVLADPPDKWKQRDGQLIGVAAELRTMIERAEDEVILISPYFVPGRDGLRWLRSLRARGLRIRVLTNSLNATDVAAVHGGYARYRRALLRAGVEIHELKRSSVGRLESPFRGSSRASLHTKAVIVDGRVAFVGSFNLDPRSTWINTEMGVRIEDAGFAEQVRAEFEHSLLPEYSYRLSMERRRVVWTDTELGKPRRQFREPTSSWSRRIIAFLARVLPVERHL